MKILFVGLLFALGMCSELAVTKEYVEELKKSVTWQVTNYEDNIFRGWSMDEVRVLLGLRPEEPTPALPQVQVTGPLPSELNWQGTCDHGVQNQGNCGSCWAFGSVGMLSSRCCLHTEDKGWRSPQELVSCDNKDHGCNGGSPYYALLYVILNGGLVPDGCFPYKAAKVPCPNQCVDKKDWKSSHECICNTVTECKKVLGMKQCLQTGPISVGFGVCKSFVSYSSGIYECDCGGQYEGYHAVLAMGYSDTPKCHWIVRNSWGPSWGEKGYFRIACETCGINGELGGANVMCNKVT